MPIFLYDDAIKSIGFQGISDPHNLPMIPDARKASRKGEPVMNTDTTFARFKKIDAHTHIGAFGSPFNIHFDTERLLQQMEAYNIEKDHPGCQRPPTPTKIPRQPSGQNPRRSSP